MTIAFQTKRLSYVTMVCPRAGAQGSNCSPPVWRTLERYSIAGAFTCCIGITIPRSTDANGHPTPVCIQGFSDLQGAGRTLPERSTTRDTMRTPIRDAPMQQSPKTSANCVFSRCEKPNDNAADEEENSTCRQHTNLHHAKFGHPADFLDHLRLWRQGPERI